jgi:hypothetical protein
MFQVTESGSNFIVSSTPPGLPRAHSSGLQVFHDDREDAEEYCKRTNRSLTLHRLKDACLDYALAHGLPDQQISDSIYAPGVRVFLELILESLSEEKQG